MDEVETTTAAATTTTAETTSESLEPTTTTTITTSTTEEGGGGVSGAAAVEDGPTDEAMQLGTETETTTTTPTTAMTEPPGAVVTTPADETATTAAAATNEESVVMETTTTSNLVEQIIVKSGADATTTNVDMKEEPSNLTTATTAVAAAAASGDNMVLSILTETATASGENGATVVDVVDQANTSAGAANDSGAGLVDADADDDSTLHEDDLGLNEDNSLKDIDDSLALSPSGLGASSGVTGGGAGSSFVMNGSNVSTHTFRKTEWDVKKLENYVKQEFGDMTPMENMDPATLNKYLKSFFEYAKKSDGMDYEPESLIGFMNSFERYLKTKNYSESLLRSETFKDSRTVLKKKRDLVRSIGKLIRTKTKDTCYLLQFHRNLLKEKHLLNRDNPDCLLAEIYLNNMIYFGEFLKEDKAWRGNLNLVWGDIVLDRDPTNGVEFLTLATYAKKSSRNHNAQPGQPRTAVRTKTGTQTSKLRAAAAAAAAAAADPNTGGGGGNVSATTGNNQLAQTQRLSLATGAELVSPRVYARQPLLYCPIEAYKVYRTRRPNNCLERDSPFYLAPLFKSKNNAKTWYKALAMSCQRLDALFYCFFKKAGVDLTSLASMTQQQQQEVLAAAAAMDPSTPRVSGYDAASICPPVPTSSGVREQEFFLFYEASR